MVTAASCLQYPGEKHAASSAEHSGRAEYAVRQAAEPAARELVAVATDCVYLFQIFCRVASISAPIAHQRRSLSILRNQGGMDRWVGKSAARGEDAESG